MEWVSKALWLAPLIPVAALAFAVWQYVHPPTVIKREAEIAKLLKEMNVSGYRDVISSLEKHVARRYGAQGSIATANRIIATAVVTMFVGFAGGVLLLFLADGWKRWAGRTTTTTTTTNSPLPATLVGVGEVDVDDGTNRPPG